MKVNEELKSLIPALSGEEYAALEDSLLAEGCRDALVVWQDTIIDGHNRYEICEKHGISYSVITKEFDSIVDVKIWMVENQFGRRNITSFVRGELALALKPLLAEKAKERMKLSQGAGIKGQAILPNLIQPIDETPLMVGGKKIDPQAILTGGEVKKQLAEKANISEGNIHKIEKLLNEGDKETLNKLRLGETTINKEYKELKKKQDLNAKKEEYIKKVNNKVNNTQSVDIFTTTDKYRVIYADPAWNYNDKQDTTALGGAAKHYDTMTIKQLCELPVAKITDDNAVLFMWVTSPLLEECFEVVKSWGFKYKSSFVWDKVAHNMGHYNSVRHELLLICTKGSCLPDKAELIDSVQSIERTKHSEKPIEFLNIIDNLYEYGNKIELFCREPKKEGWQVWGNEV